MRISKFLGMGLLGAAFFSLAGWARPLKEIPSAMTLAETEAYSSGKTAWEVLPAETFGYPNPERVLELEKELGLSTEQKTKVQALANRMRNETVLFGKRILAGELLLDEFFRKGETDPMALANRVESIGLLRWRLRFNLLSMYAITRNILTEDQLKKYRELRSPSLGGGSPK